MMMMMIKAVEKSNCKYNFNFSSPFSRCRTLDSGKYLTEAEI
jgi:hypothetical protein